MTKVEMEGEFWLENTQWHKTVILTKRYVNVISDKVTILHVFNSKSLKKKDLKLI